jgi:hypothetical protein
MVLGGSGHSSADGAPIAFLNSGTTLVDQLEVNDGALRFMRTIHIFLLAMTLSLPAGAAVYFLDANRGSDRNPGTADQPWKTLDKVTSAGLKEGDEVVLRTGHYGDWQVGLGRSDLFPGWVTLRAEEGHQPTMGQLLAGAKGGTYYGADRSGTYDLHLILDGVDLLNGFKLYGARKATFRNLLIRREKYTGGSIEAPAAEVYWGSDITLEKCEITQAGVGASLRGYRIILDGCRLYDLTHDGIRMFGAMDSVLRNTSIIGVDDGYNDKDRANTTQPDRHSDLLHFLYPGSKDLPPEFYNNNILIEGCVFALSESQGIQFNNDRRAGDRAIANKNITFRNCVFGPTRANAFNAADAVENLTVAHCSFVRVPGGMTYTSPNNLTRRTIRCNNTNLRISGGINVRVYNNILTSPTSRGFGNLINAPVSGTALPRWSEYDDSDLWREATNFDGILVDGASALGFGVDPSLWPFGFEPVRVDRHGTVRGLRPDAGAWERVGFDPAPVPVPMEQVNEVALYVDDFEDASLAEDPWLRTPTERGVEWTHWTERRMGHGRSNQARRNYLADETTTGTIMAVIGNAPLSRDLRFSYFAKNNYQSNGGGAVLFAQNLNHYYWLEVAGGVGRLWRSMERDGTNEVVTLKSDPANVRLGNSGSRTLMIETRWQPDGIRFRVDGDGGDDFKFEYVDTDPLAVATFESGGRVGFRRRYTNNKNHNIEVDNVRLEIRDLGKVPGSVRPPPR